MSSVELNKIYAGDCLETMREWPDSFIDCVVTSPPYYGLRDYHSEDQLGLEEHPDLYIGRIVEIFREIRRILKDSGTVWLNLGDSYAQGGNGGHQKSNSFHGHNKRTGDRERIFKKAPDGYKPKDLMGIPWQAALALRADGWYLRSDIIWHKLNPMPESVKDRPTKSHEYIFLLTKSSRYYYDPEAIAEKIDDSNLKRYTRVERVAEEYDKLRHKHQAQVPGRGPIAQAPMEVLTRAAKNVVEKGTRNKRDVWSMPTESFKGAHFATFPEKLIRPCILAGCPEGGIVFDPFLGSGTSAVVAQKLSCNWIGCELNSEYIAMANKRIAMERRLF